MKIIDFKAFLAMPNRTVFSEFEPCVFGPLCIKGDSIGEIDFFLVELHSAIKSTGSTNFADLLFMATESGINLALDLEADCRDAMFDQSRLFAVWDRADVAQLIARLAATL